MENHIATPLGFDDGDWPRVTVPSKPCGSLREHGPHEWTGQTSGTEFHCKGADGKQYTRPDKRARVTRL